jgi:hypothetical protein
LKVLYMSAYDDLPAEEAFGKILRKPFPLEILPLGWRGCSPRTGNSSG